MPGATKRGDAAPRPVGKRLSALAARVRGRVRKLTSGARALPAEVSCQPGRGTHTAGHYEKVAVITSGRHVDAALSSVGALVGPDLLHIISPLQRAVAFTSRHVRLDNEVEGREGACRPVEFRR